MTSTAQEIKIIEQETSNSTIAASKPVDFVKSLSWYGCAKHPQLFSNYQASQVGTERKKEMVYKYSGTIFIIDSPFNDYMLCNTGSRGYKTLKANQAFRDSL